MVSKSVLLALRGGVARGIRDGFLIGRSGGRLHGRVVFLRCISNIKFGLTILSFGLTVLSFGLTILSVGLTVLSFGLTILSFGLTVLSFGLT